MVWMELSDAAAVAKAVGGDRDAFRVLVERHSRSIFRLAYRMTQNEYDAEEVVQETFLRAYKRLASFESRANFGTWLYRIAMNCSLDFVRSRQRHVEKREQPAATDSGISDPLDGVVSESPAPDRLAMSRQMQQRIADELSKLSPTERAAFTLRHFEGQSIEEIGKVLGLRTSATKNSIFRAVQKLRRGLEPVVARAAAR
jgi:RNA polymerase sigma-70 factor (ECF subfamily)